MVILGFDPGLTAAGFALVDVNGQSRRFVESRTVKTLAATHLSQRMRELAAVAIPLVQRADLVCIEDQFGVFFGSLREGNTNASAAHLQRVMGLIEGIALGLGRKVHLIAPQRIRVVLGVSPHSDKKQVARAVRVQCSGIPEKAPLPQTDAVAIAVAGNREHSGRILTNPKLATVGGAQ